MNKFLGRMSFIGILFFVGAGVVMAQGETLSDYLADTGRKFTSCSSQERKIFAVEHGVFGYDCSADKNAELVEHLKVDDELVGFSVVTRYRTTLSSSITSSVGTINVSSLKTFDNTTLSMALLGSRVFLTIDPGNSKEEIIMCTGISGNSFTGCTRGLAFSGTSTTGVSANQKAHSSGAVIVMSNTHYVYEQLLDKDSETTVEYATGTKWFLSNGMVLGDQGSAPKYFYFCDAVNTSTCGYIFAKASSTVPSAQDIGFSPNGTDEYTFNAGGVSFSAGIGVSLSNSVLTFNPAATSTSALGYSGNQVIVTTTFPNGLIVNADGLALATSSPQVWAASTTIGNSAYNGLFAPFVTSTQTTSTFSSSVVNSSTLVQANTVNTNFLNVSSTPITTLITNASSFVSSTSQNPTITAASEVDVINVSIPANTLKQDQCVFAELMVTDFDNPNPIAWSGRIYYGATNIATIQQATAVSNLQGDIQIRLCGDGSTQKQFGSVTFKAYNDVASEGIDTGASGVDVSRAFGAATEDSTGAKVFRFSTTFSSITGTPSITIKDSYVYKLVR
jgi:hypothetical protein